MHCVTNTVKRRGDRVLDIEEKSKLGKDEKRGKNSKATILTRSCRSGTYH